ncbi:hypothetical protein GF314_08785, partial [bacterium]|nr:hypothetical protein [bacterium]
MVERPDTAAYGGHAPHTASIATVLHHAGWHPIPDDPAGPTVDALEALLYGIAGGAVFGAFFFHYEGHDPQVNLITRNTFHEYGWDAVCSRLGIAQDVIRSTSAAKAEAKLRDLVEDGASVIA